MSHSYGINNAHDAFETRKKKLGKAPILRFPDWSKKFHFHIDALAIIVGPILAQPRDDNLDHPNAYASCNLNKAKRNYSMTGHEGLGINFSIHKFWHYLLDNPFIFYTNHQALKYLVKKPLHPRWIYWSILLFKEFEFEFEFIVWPGQTNISLDHLLIFHTVEELIGIEIDLPDAHLFKVEEIPKELVDIVQFLQDGKSIDVLLEKRKKILVIKKTPYSLINESLYKLENDYLLLRCALPHQR